MESMHLVSCFRFSMQLIIAESVFLIGRSRRERFGARLALTAVGYCILAAAWFFLLKLIPGENPLAYILFYFGLLGLTMTGMRVCFDLPWIEILFAGTGGYATEHIVFALVRIFQFVTGITSDSLNPIVDNICVRFLPYVAGAALMYRFLIRPNRDKEEFKQKDLRMVQAATFVLLFAIILSVYYSTPAITGEENVVNAVICPLYSAMSCLLVLLMEYYVFRENRLSREKETMEQLLQLASAQQRTSREAIDIINLKCHDLKHQIKALAAMNDAAQRSAYVAEAEKAISIYDATYHTGCEAVDYVLREKALLADEYQVQFSCMADGAAIAFLHPADIYALLGNALDNALESVLREPEEQRIISLKIVRHGQMVSLHLENTCSRTLEFQNGLPQTDKEDKRYHGFGVQSIRYLVQKYQGECTMEQAEGMFRLDILLPVPAEQA